MTAIAGDVTSSQHRAALAEAVGVLGGLDLLVNNASLLGAPLVQLADLGDDTLRRLYDANVVAPLALVQAVLPALRASGGTVVNVSSDAAVEHYDTWGGYGSSKAALDHLTATLAVEEPAVRWLSFDPGDIHADARGGVPGRGHLGPSGAGDGRTPPSGPHRGLASERSLPRRRDGGRTMTAVTSERPRAAATMGVGLAGGLGFDLPVELEASEPPEARGLTRDAVRMLVASRSSGTLVHSTFFDLPLHLCEGDLVVVNTSGTLAAEVSGTGQDGRRLDVHLSTRLPAGLWTVELRAGGRPVLDAEPGERIELPAGGSVSLLTPYAAHDRGVRLWVAQVTVPAPLPAYLSTHGRPIRYGYVRGEWPISAYQNVYVTEPGSAEMPSAGRPFSPEVITPPRRPGRRRHAAAAAHRRCLARSRRAPLRRVLPGAGRHGPASQRRPP